MLHARSMRLCLTVKELKKLKKKQIPLKTMTLTKGVSSEFLSVLSDLGYETPFEITVPGVPPSINHMYIQTRNRKFPNPEAVEWGNKATALIREAWKEAPLECWCLVSITVHRKVSIRKYDAYNYGKLPQDCLERGGVIRNDYLALATMCWKEECSEREEEYTTLEVIAIE